MELVDIQDLKSWEALKSRVGSIPTPGTKIPCVIVGGRFLLYFVVIAPISALGLIWTHVRGDKKARLSYLPHFAPIAQLVELLPLKEKVVGSNPTGRTKDTKSAMWQDGCLLLGWRNWYTRQS